jgi:hypothetical protein
VAPRVLRSSSTLTQLSLLSSANDVQASDQALAQEIAVETSLHLSDSESSLAKLGTLAVQASTPVAMQSIFQAFQAAHSDVDQVYWLDPVEALVVSCPPLPGKCQDKLEAEFSPPDVVQRARRASDPVFEVGAAVNQPSTLASSSLTLCVLEAVNWLAS